MAQQLQLSINAFFADTNRNSLHLSHHIHVFTQLNRSLKTELYGRKPLEVWQLHFTSTRDLIESLRTIEAGLSQGLDTQSSIVSNRFDMSNDLLKELLRSGMKDKHLAGTFDMHENTIIRRRTELYLEIRAPMHAMTGEIHKNHVLDYLAKQNEVATGVMVVSRHLQNIEVAHSREHLRRIMRELKLEEYQNRASHTVQRRQYHVPFINSLWHIDSHMKLMRWKFAVHAGIDGKSHVVTFIGVNDNNHSVTVEGLFLRGTQT